MIREAKILIYFFIIYLFLIGAWCYYDSTFIEVCEESHSVVHVEACRSKRRCTVQLDNGLVFEMRSPTMGMKVCTKSRLERK